MRPDLPVPPKIQSDIEKTAPAADAQRRAELRRFLRRHREALSAPLEREGMPARRRTPGLRREEVAERAGMSSVWYTWLEMGRPVQMSAKMLGGVARALELTGDETEYLYALVGKPEPFERKQTGEAVEPALRGLIDAYPFPACVLDAMLDLTGTNGAYRKLFAQSEHLTGFERNVLWRAFNVPDKRERHVNWSDQVDDLTALFRRNYADFVGDPGFESLIAELRNSDDFSALWAQQRVLRRAPRQVTIFHPRIGRFTLESVYVAAPSSPLSTIVFCVPDAEGGVAEKLRRFLAK